MTTVVPKVAVVGSGISGAVCASTLAKNGVAVTVFDLGRGPGGRMSQRRETTEDGKELLFDHGAPYFTVTNPAAMELVLEWESRSLVAEWKEKFGNFDCTSMKFINADKEPSGTKYVGIPGMNSICRALCNEPGVDSKFGTGVAKMEWVDENSWSLIGLNGRVLGNFDGVVATDKILASSGFTSLTGHPPPLDTNWHRGCKKSLSYLISPSCWRLLSLYILFESFSLQISVGAFSFINSEVLSSAFCDSSKPGRASASQCWVLHSTPEYAAKVIAQSGLKKPSDVTYSRVSQELLQEFERTGLCTSQPSFLKAHRWGSAFPTASIAREDLCLWDLNKRLAVCGDFCVSPNVEGAIASGIAAS